MGSDFPPIIVTLKIYFCKTSILKSVLLHHLGAPGGRSVLVAPLGSREWSCWVAVSPPLLLCSIFSECLSVALVSVLWNDHLEIVTTTTTREAASRGKLDIVIHLNTTLHQHTWNTSWCTPHLP